MMTFYILIIRINSMADFNLVQMETQGQNPRDETQRRILHFDIKGLQRFASLLKDVQENSNKILKLYHDYLQQHTRKTPGLPYHMIKKFQNLKNSLLAAQTALIRQCRFLRTEISNREFQKANEQQFFKKALVGYDQKRIWMKNYILKNEKRVQAVEQEVLKDMEYEKHKYTQFTNTIDLQRLQHNFHPKLDILSSIAVKVAQNLRLRARISERLSQMPKNSPKITQDNLQTDFPIRKESYTSLSFLYCLQTKAQAIRQLIFHQLNSILKIKSRVILNNKQLKIAIDKASQSLQQLTLQACIILAQAQHQPAGQSQHQKIMTKTDNLIFLKEVHREVHQRIKIFGQYFQYTLSNSQKYPNAHKSKSLRKNYEMQVTEIRLKQKKESVSQFLQRNHQQRLEHQRSHKKQEIRILETQTEYDRENRVQKFIEAKLQNIIGEEREQDKMIQ